MFIVEAKIVEPCHKRGENVMNNYIKISTIFLIMQFAAYLIFLEHPFGCLVENLYYWFINIILFLIFFTSATSKGDLAY